MPELPAGLYALLTDDLLPIEAHPEAAGLLAAAGAAVIQLRLKAAPDRERLASQRAVMERLRGWRGVLCVNDRADLAVILAREAPPGLRAALHLGQDDLPPVAARAIVGPEVLVGLSTHDLDQIAAAEGEPVDYLGFGPIFPTGTKVNPDPVVGLDGARGLAAAARATSRPLVAIGGIGLERLREVRAAGARAIALASALSAGGLGGLEARARAAAEALR